MPLQTLLSVDKSQVSVAPGATVELGVTAQNLTTLLDQVAVRIDGIPKEWVRVIPEYLPVFGQGTATARVVLAPPRDAATALAGKYPLRVYATSQENPGQEGETICELEIQLIGDYALNLQRAESGDAQTENYTVMVQNHANAQLQVRLSGKDDVDAFWCKFEPFQVVAPAGGQAVSSLSARPKRPGAAASAVPFHVEAQGNFALKSGALAGAPMQHVVGQFFQVQAPAVKIAVVPVAGQGGLYRVAVDNPGAQPITALLTATDAQNMLEFQFEPGELVLAPRSSSTARLLVRLRAPLQPGEPSVRSFSVSVQPVDNQARPASAESSYAPSEPIKQPFPWLVLVVVALALLVLIILVALVLLR